VLRLALIAGRAPRGAAAPSPDSRVARLSPSPVTCSIDIAPTILELVGLQPIGQGRSLLPALLRGEPLAEYEVFFGPSIPRGRDDASTFKFMAQPRNNVFYDLDADPGEQENRFDDPSFIVDQQSRLRRLHGRIQSLRREAQGIARTFSRLDVEDPEMSEADVEALRALGYL
jgi:arylsulfatase A-like enzyme